ncbi:MAG: hypothetical protein ABIP80_07430 [Ferruginibacter sp.]
MQKRFLIFILTSVILYCSSCARGISPYEAANGKAKCGRNYIK